MKRMRRTLSRPPKIGLDENPITQALFPFSRSLRALLSPYDPRVKMLSFKNRERGKRALVIVF